MSRGDGTQGTALARALQAVNVEKRQVLLYIICQGGGV